jgi:hypothetical protein
MFFPFVLSLAVGMAQPNQISLDLLSVDPLTNSSSMHQTEVGPVVGANGNNVVFEMLVGRNTGDGAPAMGVSTITSKGLTAQLLPGLTQYQNPAGPYSAVSFPSIAWNAVYGDWIVTVLGITGNPNGNDTTHAPVVLRSNDGINWSAPQAIAPDTLRPEKNMIACDNNYWTSKYVGNCYVVWDDNNNNNLFHANASTNGGQTWGPTKNPADNHSAYGAYPVIQPNGTVVVSSEDYSGYGDGGANIISFVSSDGGNTWSGASEISKFQMHTVAGNMRTQALPASGVDYNGVVYTVWQDCRFRTNCSSNDIVLSTSKDGKSWTSPARIPLDSSTSGVDHFLPALSVESTWFGTTLALSYYYFPQANCTVSTCQLYAAYATSNNGGQNWSSPTTLAGPISLSWLPLTGAGYMVGDYFGTAIVGNGLYAPLAVAYSPNNGTFNEATYLPVSCNWHCSPTKGLAAGVPTQSLHQMTMGRLQPARPAPQTRSFAPRVNPL